MNPHRNKNRAGTWAQPLLGFSRIVLIATTFMASTAVLARENVDETRPLAADGHVMIENEFGEIIIRGWDRDEVRIAGYLSDDVRELQMRESGNALRIRVEYLDRRTIDGADLEITVPEGAGVEA